MYSVYIQRRKKRNINMHSHSYTYTQTCTHIYIRDEYMYETRSRNFCKNDLQLLYALSMFSVKFILCSIGIYTLCLSGCVYARVIIPSFTTIFLCCFEKDEEILLFFLLQKKVNKGQKWWWWEYYSKIILHHRVPLILHIT